MSNILRSWWSSLFLTLHAEVQVYPEVASRSLSSSCFGRKYFLVKLISNNDLIFVALFSKVKVTSFSTTSCAHIVSDPSTHRVCFYLRNFKIINNSFFNFLASNSIQAESISIRNTHDYRMFEILLKLYRHSEASSVGRDGVNGRN